MREERAAWAEMEAAEAAYEADEIRYDALNLPPQPVGTQAGSLPPETSVYLWHEVVTLMMAARTTEPEEWLSRDPDEPF